MAPVTRPKITLLVLLACLLAPLGCSLPPTPPAPEHLRLVVTPSATRLVEQLSEAYRLRRGHAHLEVREGNTEAALNAVDRRSVDLALIARDLDPSELLDPDTGKPRRKVWPIATDGIAVVVHPSNPVQSLTRAELRQVFAGLERQWSSLGGPELAPRLVSREAGAPARSTFEEGVLEGSVLAGVAVIMPNDRAVADYVAKHPEAIGYLSVGWAEGVKVIAVDGVLPTPATVASEAYPLRQPLAIVTSAAVVGKSRAFIDFVRSPEGQAIIAGHCALLP